MEHHPPAPVPGANPEIQSVLEALRGLQARVSHARAVSDCLLGELPCAGEPLPWNRLNRLAALAGAVEDLLGLAEAQAGELERALIGGDP